MTTDIQPREITPQAVMADLDLKARELDALSAGMASVARQLEPVEDEYRAFVDAFDVGLWQKHVDEDAKLPSAEMRLKLAHHAMSPDLYGRYFALTRSRDRMVKRVAALKVSIEAQRSLLSAMKEGLVA